MLTHRVPFPPNRGDRIRAFHMLSHLADRFEVSLACTSDEPVSNEQHQHLRRLVKRLEIRPIARSYSKMRGILALLSGRAITPGYFYRRQLGSTVVDWHRESPFDITLTFCTGMIQYARDLIAADRQLRRRRVRKGRMRHVIDLVDVDSAKWSEYAKTARPPMHWIYHREAGSLRKIESGRFDQFDAITVVSHAEAAVYRDQVGEHPNLAVIPQAVDLEFFEFEPDAGSRTLVFIGVLDYKPNVDGVCWFVSHVLPLLESLPGVRVQLIGLRPEARVLALDGTARVEVVGEVPDVRPYLRGAAAVIVPLQVARGVQTKILEGMASGRVVLSTPSAAEGIEAKPSEHLLVSESAEDWARQIRRVLLDRDFRTSLAKAARRQVEEHHSWDRSLQLLEALLMDTLDGPA